MSEFDGRITKLYGERCPDHEPSCACCVVWDMRDRIEALEAGNETLCDLIRQGLAQRDRLVDSNKAQAKEIAELRAALQAILIADTGVVEGSSNKPVLCYGLCAGMVKDLVNQSREETLRLVRAKPRS